MESQREKQLFDAIKNDDVKMFDSLIVSKSDLNLCFGRFPLLSICYLYGSYSILNKYESYMISIKNYTQVEEFFEIYLKFKTYAKKSLRLFADGEIVYPILMLAVIDERKKIANYYKILYKNSEILEKLLKIYSITNSENVVANSNEFVASKKKNDSKQLIWMSLVSLLLCFVIIFPTFCLIFVNRNIGKGTIDNPIKVKSERAFADALTNNYEYISIEKDIELTSQVNVSEFTGTIFGNNHTITFSALQKKSLVSDLYGTIKNVNFAIDNNNLELTDNMAFLADNLYGIIDNCTFSGNLNAKFNTSDEKYLSIFVLGTDAEATIKNSTCSVSVTCSNESNSNIYFTNFAITNNGKIDSCSTGENDMLMDIVNIAGIAVNNTGIISNTKNKQKILQESNKQIDLIASGIALENTGTISNVENYGNISSISTLEELKSTYMNSSLNLYSNGIVFNNNGTLENSENYGNIYTQSILANNYSVGIANNNYNTISNVKNYGEIESVSKIETILVIYGYINVYSSSSGLVDENNGQITDSENHGKVYSQSVVANTYAAGIVRANNLYTISNVKNYGEVCAISTLEDPSNGKNIYLELFACGVVVTNSGTIYNSENHAKINGQTTKATYCFVSGVVGSNDVYSNYFIQSENTGNISNCYNYGDLSLISSGDNIESMSSFASGIAANNKSIVDECNSSGKIHIENKSSIVYVGGISGYSSYSSSKLLLNDSHSDSNIEVISESSDIYVGGILGFGENVDISGCGFTGNIEFSSKVAYVGGIAGQIKTNRNSYQIISNKNIMLVNFSTIINSYSISNITDKTSTAEINEELETIDSNKFISSIVGQIAIYYYYIDEENNFEEIIYNIFNTDDYYGGNKVVKSDLPVAEYKYINNIKSNEDYVLHNSDLKPTIKVTTYETEDELLESLKAEEA